MTLNGHFVLKSALGSASVLAFGQTTNMQSHVYTVGAKTSM